MLCYMRKIRSLHTSTTGRTNYFKVFVQFKFKNSIYAFCVVIFYGFIVNNQRNKDGLEDEKEERN